MGADRNTMIQENRQICIQFQLLADHTMAQKGLTAVQARILLYILSHSEEGTSLTRIQQEFGCSKAALSELVKQLRKKGYVRSEPSQRDNRCKILLGTDKGKQVRDFLNGSFHRATEQLYSGFSPEELAILDRLQKMQLNNLSAMRQSGNDNSNHNKEVSKS